MNMSPGRRDDFSAQNKHHRPRKQRRRSASDMSDVQGTVECALSEEKSPEPFKRASKHESHSSEKTKQQSRFDCEEDGCSSGSEKRIKKRKHSERRRRLSGSDDRNEDGARNERDRKHKRRKRDRRASSNNTEDRRSVDGRRHNRDGGDEHRRRHHTSAKHMKRHPHDTNEEENHRPRDSSRDRDVRHRSSHANDRPRHEPRSRSPVQHSKVRVKQERLSPESRKRDIPRDPLPQKPGPDFKLSGKLTADTNTYKGVVIKYNQPPEARKAREKWRLYPFKGDTCLPVVPLHRSSGYLIGRDRIVADIPIDHPSCSKQHAVIQFRLVDITKADGTMGRKVKPYAIDIGSTNGTYLNGKRIESERYHELREKDVLKFGFSSREYVLLHEKSQTDEVDEGFE